MPGISDVLRVGKKVFLTYDIVGRGIKQFHNAYSSLNLTALGHQEAWEKPSSRSGPFGLQVGGPAMKLPDQYGK
jgi:predicted dithiol-disulfide oxidoreductase (DUF899 family)